MGSSTVKKSAYFSSISGVEKHEPNPITMNYTSKIKTSDSIFLPIYKVFFSAMSKEAKVEQLIKEIQHAANNRHKVEYQSWKSLCKLIIGEGSTETKKGKTIMDSHNENRLAEMSEELAPFAKEFILLCQNQGIHVRILTGVNITEEPENSMYQYGLTFDIGVFDKSSSGDLIYNGDILRYAQVAKLAESIGLSWAADQKTFAQQSRFFLRPAWALRMKDEEMYRELARRKAAKENLIQLNTI